MEPTSDIIEPLIKAATDYSKTSIELLKLQAVKKASIIAPRIITTTIVIVLLSLFLLILNVGVAIWLGELLGKLYYGFFVVAGFYALLTLVFYYGINKGIRKSVGNWIISQLLK